MPATWSNWARTATMTPRRTAMPSTVEQVQSLVRSATAAGERVRMVGSGHSFTPVALTDGLLLRPDELRGIVSADTATGHVTVLAGTTLHSLGPALAALGLGMANMGDIDVQTVAGAVQTGTHGTGARFGGLATQVVGLDLVTPDGDLLHADADNHPDVFGAARVGLGAFGVLASLTLACVPAFALQAQEAPMGLDDVLSGLDELVDGTDHFEFYWFPHTRRTLTKRNTRLPGTTALQPLSRLRRYVDDDLLSNRVFDGLNRVATRWPGAIPRLNAVSARALSARTFTDAGHRVFATRRTVVFREMEYAVPRAALPHVLAEVDRWLRTSGEQVAFPLEIRFAPADDVWLSTAYERESAYIAVHQYHRRDHTRYFAAVEAIMSEVDGRPHWGKLHGLDHERLEALYPRLAQARAVRDRLDPQGAFANDYTDRVLGPRG